MSVALRIGLIVPSSNTVVEPELARLLANRPEIELLATRIEVTHIGAGADSDQQFGVERIVAAGRLLAQAGVDVLVWAGTSGSWLGIEYDLSAVRALEQATGTPATTASLGLIQACRAYGVADAFVVTPYQDEVVAGILATLGREGITVSGERHLGLTVNHSFAAVGAGELCELVESAAAGSARAVLVICTNLRALPLVPSLEEMLGRPVFDSVAACLSAAMSRAGMPLALDGAGTLLATGARRAVLQEVCDRLLAQIGADRVTIRLADAELAVEVAMPVAEAVAAGVRSIRWDPTLDQRALETVRWVEAHRELLVQPNFSRAPYPPDALREVYGVRAQMLAPVPERRLPDQPPAGVLRGWVSVHSGVERDWTVADEQAIVLAASAIAASLDC